MLLNELFSELDSIIDSTNKIQGKLDVFKEKVDNNYLETDWHAIHCLEDIIENNISKDRKTMSLLKRRMNAILKGLNTLYKN